MTERTRTAPPPDNANFWQAVDRARLEDDPDLGDLALIADIDLTEFARGLGAWHRLKREEWFRRDG